jgi:hypothetical protein
LLLSDQEKIMNSLCNFLPSRSIRHAMLGLSFGVLAAAVAAQSAPTGAANQQSGDRPHGPPPEAITACSGKAAGAACSFVGRRGEQLSGTCFTPPPRPASAQDANGSYGAKNATQEKMPMACRPHHDQ